MLCSLPFVPPKLQPSLFHGQRNIYQKAVIILGLDHSPGRPLIVSHRPPRIVLEESSAPRSMCMHSIWVISLLLAERT